MADNSIAKSADVPDDVDLPPTNETFRIPRKLVAQENFVKMISWDTLDYVTASLGGTKNMPHKICPLTTPGDGNCLLHAVSLSLWGVEKYYAPTLRKKLKEELVTYKDFYSKSVDKRHEDEEEQGYKPAEYDNFLKEVSAKNAHLGMIHIFALSNLLKRPIYLYASDEDMKAWGAHEEGVTGLFLPTRYPASECVGGPLAIAWSNELKNHFVPLCPIEGIKFDWPGLDLVYAKSLATEEAKDNYITKGMEKDVPFQDLGNLSEAEIAKFHKIKESMPKDMMKLMKEISKKIRSGNSSSSSSGENGGKKKYYLIQTPTGTHLVQADEDGEEGDEDEEEEEELFDVVCPIRLKEDDVRYIGFNHGDDLDNTIRTFLIEHTIPMSFYNRIHTFLTKVIEDAKKTTSTEPPKKKPLPFSRILYDKERVPENSQFIPYKGPPVIYHVGQIDKIVAKILQINQLEIEAINRKLRIGSFEENQLLDIVEKVAQGQQQNLQQQQVQQQQQPQQQLFFADFSWKSLSVFKQLLKWPSEKLFPVVDLARLVVLHPKGAKFFYSQHGDNHKSLLYNIFKLCTTPTLDYAYILTALKFIANMYHQQVLVQFFLYNNLGVVQILEHVLDNLSFADKNVNVVEIITRILTNMTAHWLTYGHGTDRARYLTAREMAANACFKIIKTKGLNEKENIVLGCLVPLGNILIGNAGLTYNESPMNYLNLNSFSVAGQKNIIHCIEVITKLMMRRM